MTEEVTGLPCLVCFFEDDIPGPSLADRNPGGLKLKSYVFGLNAETIQAKDCGQKLNLLKSYYDENRIFPIAAISKHKQVARVRRKVLFTIFKYLFSFQRYSSFLNMQISPVMTSYIQPYFDQI